MIYRNVLATVCDVVYPQYHTPDSDYDLKCRKCGEKEYWNSTGGAEKPSNGRLMCIYYTSK